ncbi:unnamed protein product [Aphanomyces euteiches]|uniref:Uncharacterized protein n=1 Tax=Aphanomyces euteiches TaxID=100861 RepID=A0A6G0WFS2_9STRA|nr:hypothetical protein Ae201684_015714 [Aphanomyces euteiches]KAH9093851.1 hypothetical protein Ae201684P_016473 [Aphanomyces euteiches]KAH9134761.1 hypothetical protein AeRB84_019530 [Aphanomyces euteiches]
MASLHAKLSAFVATSSRPPLTQQSSSLIPPLLRPTRSTDSTSTALLDKFRAWRHDKLHEFVLSWPQLQQVKYLLYDIAVLLPPERDVVQWIHKRQTEIREALDADPTCQIPPGLEELDHMLAFVSTPRLNYSQLCSLRNQLPKAAQIYCTPEIFMQLEPHDMHGRMDGLAWLAFVERASLQIEAFAFVQSADKSDKGFLTEAQLTALINEWLVRVPWKTPPEPAFESYFIMQTTRRLWLSLVPYGTGKLHLDKAMRSPDVHALLQLLCRDYHDSPAYSSNPFAVETIQTLHRQYVQLDTDKNGLLSPTELLDYGRKKAFVKPEDMQPTHCFTRRFIQRVFDVMVTYEGEMDYKTFMDFSLYMRDETSKAALQFFWRLFDVHACGGFGATAIEYFLSDIAEKAHEMTGSSVDIGILRSEMFDMIQPKDPSWIQFDDVFASGHGHVFVRVLTDYQAFVAYDRRENK